MSARRADVPASGEPAELVLWTGRPGWAASAVRVWKAPWIAAYFAVLLADGARLAWLAPHDQGRAWVGEGRLLAAAIVVLAAAAGLAWLTCRSTRYTVGSRAITLRYGMALPARLVIPFAAIEAVAARIHADGTGDVALTLRPGPRVSYLKLWPHARPWRLGRAEPMLRCVPDAGSAAALICRALAARDGVPDTADAPSGTPARTRGEKVELERVMAGAPGWSVGLPALLLEP